MNEKLELRASIAEIVNAIDTENDWFCAYVQEPDTEKKSFYAAMHESKKCKLTKTIEKEEIKYD